MLLVNSAHATFLWSNIMKLLRSLVDFLINPDSIKQCHPTLDEMCKDENLYEMVRCPTCDGDGEVKEKRIVIARDVW